ncbi:MAG: hypothetical protein ACTSPB_04805 [Candidatus Thorarchaeota archaeon]
MKQQFIEKNFRTKSWNLIHQCNTILNTYKSQGYDLSLRQLYYQLVSRDIIPNSQRSYGNLGNLVNDARLAGLLDWSMIVDRGRSTIANTHWNNPAEIVRAAANSFRIDKWKNQPNHIEVMVEKQALEGVLQPVCSRLDVNFTANKGYSSQSFMYSKGRALKRMQKAGKAIHVLYLGDHDPSGLDMDRDIDDRLSMFSELPVVNVDRLALTMNQIEQYKPPENPAKITDTRAKKYIQKHGYSSWELDALEPKKLAQLVTDAVEALRDPDLWDDTLAKEAEMKTELDEWADEYEGKG